MVQLAAPGVWVLVAAVAAKGGVFWAPKKHTDPGPTTHQIECMDRRLTCYNEVSCCETSPGIYVCCPDTQTLLIDDNTHRSPSDSERRNNLTDSQKCVTSMEGNTNLTKNAVGYKQNSSLQSYPIRTPPQKVLVQLKLRRGLDSVLFHVIPPYPPELSPFIYHLGKHEHLLSAYRKEHSAEMCLAAQKSMLRVIAPMRTLLM